VSLKGDVSVSITATEVPQYGRLVKFAEDVERLAAKSEEAPPWPEYEFDIGEELRKLVEELRADLMEMHKA
jgi:hypothetical protein